jgi:hypothetical protein
MLKRSTVAATDLLRHLAHLIYEGSYDETILSANPIFAGIDWSLRRAVVCPEV